MSDSTHPALDGICPISYFAVGKPLPGQPEYSSTYEGNLYHFVSEEAKHEFDSNPEKYAPAFGGLCAFGMSIEKEFESDPNNFKIIDGKLYLFLKNADTDALELWNKEDETKCLANANRHWQSKSTV